MASDHYTTIDRMAGHRKSDQSRVYPGAGVFRKRASKQTGVVGDGQPLREKLQF
jgi:hypothetical protein